MVWRKFYKFKYMQKILQFPDRKSNKEFSFKEFDKIVNSFRP